MKTVIDASFNQSKDDTISNLESIIKSISLG